MTWLAFVTGFMFSIILGPWSDSLWWHTTIIVSTMWIAAEFRLQHSSPS